MPYADKAKQKEAQKRLDAARYLRKKEEINKRGREWKRDNKEWVTEYNKEWRKNNRECLRKNDAIRRARQFDAVPEALKSCPVEKKRLKEVYKLRELMQTVTGEAYHVDHMWPLVDGGPHWSGNLQVITAKDNLSKGRTVDEDVKRTIQEGLEYACSIRH